MVALHFERSCVVTHENIKKYGGDIRDNFSQRGIIDQFKIVCTNCTKPCTYIFFNCVFLLNLYFLNKIFLLFFKKLRNTRILLRTNRIKRATYNL